MNVSNIIRCPLPTSTETVFDRILTLGWYDGITEGLVCCHSSSFAFKFNILAWELNHFKRVYTLSSIPISSFNTAVDYLIQFEQPKWPQWHFNKWPSDLTKHKIMIQELDQILLDEEKPSFVVETESMFKTIYGIKKLTDECMNLIPNNFDGYPYLDNFGYWHAYLGICP